MSLPSRDGLPPLASEWLEADGLGGFASGTVGFVRTRRYHALLLAAARPPTDRFVLVGAVDVWLRTPRGRFALCAHEFTPGVTAPDGGSRIRSFRSEPWPTWDLGCEDGTRVRFEVCVPRGTPRTVLRWTLLDGPADGVVEVRPLISGRDYHGLHFENDGARLGPEPRAGGLAWRLYDGVPGVTAHANGEYRHDPCWYKSFLYTQERDRGFACQEDLCAPGVFELSLSAKQAAWLVLTAETEAAADTAAPVDGDALVAGERARRAGAGSVLDRAAERYLVRRGRGTSIIAGYPWFADWGRDTFISMRGLCLATGRLTEARSILLEWAGAVSEGMLPNRFPDRGEEPEYNSVDAALWYVVCVHEFLRASERAGLALGPGDRGALADAVREIIAGHVAGTRFGIRVEEDGLLAAGEPGVQLTWMDARVGERVITPRIGKPVEVQALWLNAVWAAGRMGQEWGEQLDKGVRSFRERFWNEPEGCLHDVVDAEHVAGRCDSTVRPNQIMAIGGLPVSLLGRARAQRVVEEVERRLLTPVGLRSLDPSDPAYKPRYEGGPSERDERYHQGTAWPWLMGPFVEAWVRVRGGTEAARRQARERFVRPLIAHLGEAGLGHVSEIADAAAPHAPRGCPFQAWSLGELIRLDRVVLARDSGGGREVGMLAEDRGAGVHG